MKTTLRKIKEHDPCEDGWKKLLNNLNKTEEDNDELSLLTILESNGVIDCVWAFRCVDGQSKIFRLIAADFAESVLPLFEKKYPDDKRPRLAIQAARDFAEGKIDAAARDARAAALAAAGAARAAALATGAAARDAAGAAAGAAAEAALAAREAALATWAAARDAAWAAAWAAARDAARDAAAAAREDERQKQYKILLKYLS